MEAAILVVEDNKVLQALFVMQLSKFGLKCDCANNGVEALERFMKHQNYQLILMDVMMPEIDGLEATALIREFEQAEDLVRVPIVGITAMDNHDTCLAVGMDDYYQKPLLPEQMKELIDKWIPGI